MIEGANLNSNEQLRMILNFFFAFVCSQNIKVLVIVPLHFLFVAHINRAKTAYAKPNEECHSKKTSINAFCLFVRLFSSPELFFRHFVCCLQFFEVVFRWCVGGDVDRDGNGGGGGLHQRGLRILGNIPSTVAASSASATVYANGETRGVRNKKLSAFTDGDLVQPPLRGVVVAVAVVPEGKKGGSQVFGFARHLIGC